MFVDKVVRIFFAFMVVQISTFSFANGDEGIGTRLVVEAIKKAAPDSNVVDLEFHVGIGMYYFQTDVDGVSGYITPDGKYVMPSDLMKIAKDGSLIDDTQDRVVKSIITLPDEMFITFPARSKSKLGQVVILSDITCAYCKLLHERVTELQEAGVTVKYLPYPRQGIDSMAARDMELIWCSSDREANLTNAHEDLGLSVNASEYQMIPNCINKAVNVGYLKGKALKISGTPFLVFEDGSVHPGYMLFEDIIKRTSKISLATTKTK